MYSTTEWRLIITEDCAVMEPSVAPGHVIVLPTAENANPELVIAAGAILELDFYNYGLLVKTNEFGQGGVFIVQQEQPSAALRQVSGTIGPGDGSSGYEGLVFHHEDHLSGGNVDTDESGNVVQVLDYFPFGDVRVDEQSGEYANDYWFTGKERDEDTGLYYYEVRYYDSGVGRFVSIDPWFGDISDPQSLNKYSYVLNNPLKYVDVTGLIPNKNQAVTISRVTERIRTIENKYSDFDYKTTLRAINIDFYRSGGQGTARYVYLEEEGWIDFKHFFGAAEYGGLLAKALGLGKEIVQFLKDDSSAFSPEDLGSNSLGADFGSYIKSFSEEDLKDKKLSDLFEEFIKDYTAIDPIKAPDFNDLPDEEYGDGSSATENHQKHVENEKEHRKKDQKKKDRDSKHSQTA